jgi:dTDP-4-dehydrorhamnose reductase
MTRTLILGAGGQVGAAIVREIGPENAITADIHAGSGVQYGLDLAASSTFSSELGRLLASTRPEVVINAAGMTWVDGCEADPELAIRVNATAAQEVALQARCFGASNVYFSTEYIFDGAGGPYSEMDEPRPLSAYGRSKLSGERAVLAADPDGLIIRTTVVYGPERLGKNFAYQLAGALLSGRPIRVPSDQVSSPTYNVDLAAATMSLVRDHVSGICNVAGFEVLDRCTFARRLARAIHADEDLIQPVTTFALGQRAKRPLQAGLRVDRLRSLLPDCRLRTPEEAASNWRLGRAGKPWPAPEKPVPGKRANPPADRL